MVGLVVFVVALIGLLWSALQWIAVELGPLTDQRVLRVLTLSLTGLAAAFQLRPVASASLMEIPQRSRGRRATDYAEDTSAQPADDE